MELKLEEAHQPKALVITGTNKSHRPVSEILKDLGSSRRPIRAAAEAEMARLGPESSEELLAALEDEGHKHRKRQRIVKRSMVGFVTFILLYLTFGLVLGLTTGKWDVLSNFGSLCGTFGALGAAAAISPQFRSLATAMSTLDDVRSVGWLVDAMTSQDKQLQASAESALVRLLPKLTAADRNLLDDEQRRRLDKQLQKSRSRDFAVAILEAYEKVGDSQSLGAIGHFAEGHGASPFDPHVRRVAMRAEDAIRVRAETERQARTLLRATVDTGEDVLLRPAAGSSAVEDTLLRAAED